LSGVVFRLDALTSLTGWFLNFGVIFFAGSLVGIVFCLAIELFRDSDAESNYSLQFENAFDPLLSTNTFLDAVPHPSAEVSKNELYGFYSLGFAFN
jgi:hypothetical protein